MSDTYTVVVRLRLLQTADVVFTETYANVSDLCVVDEIIRDRVATDRIGPLSCKLMDIEVTATRDMSNYRSVKRE